MLITFKSEGAADVLMFGDVAFALMEVMGKLPSPRGVIAVADLAGALARLKAAMARDHQAPQPLEPGGKRSADDDEPGRFVSLSQRALPLLGMLEHALAEEAPVLWGV